MFESAELGHKIDKKTFKAEVPRLARRTRGFCGDATDLDVNAPPAWRQRLGRGSGA